MVKLTRELLVQIHDATAPFLKDGDEIHAIANPTHVDSEDFAEFLEPGMLEIVGTELPYLTYRVTLCKHPIIIVTSKILPEGDIYLHVVSPDKIHIPSYTYFPYSDTARDEIAAFPRDAKVSLPAIVKFDA